MKPIENRTFIENMRSWGIEVFRKCRVEDTSCESDHMAHTICNRESDTSEKFITSFTDKNPRINEKLRSKSFFFEIKPKISWGCRTTKLELCDRRISHISCLQIFEKFVILFLIEGLVIPFARRAIEGVDISTCICFFFLEIGLELDSSFLSKDLDRLSKFDLFNLHKEF